MQYIEDELFLLSGALATAVRNKTNMFFGLQYTFSEWKNPLYVNDMAANYTTTYFVEVNIIHSLTKDYADLSMSIDHFTIILIDSCKINISNSSIFQITTTFLNTICIKIIVLYRKILSCQEKNRIRFHNLSMHSIPIVIV